MARPFKYDWELVKQQLADYINTTQDPQLKEFCLNDDVPGYDVINEHSKSDIELSHLIKKLLSKQEVFLTRAKDINPIMALFRLKQPWHGYKDKQDIDISTTVSYQIPDQLKKLTD